MNTTRPLVRGLLAGLALTALGALPVLADPPAPQDVARDFLRGRVAAKNAQEGWAASGTTPLQALQLLRETKIAPGKTGEVELTLRDAHERQTQVLLRVPKAPRADGRYGVMIVLHGLGGHAAQLLPFAERIAPAGTIVVAPGAQKLTPELENVDIPKMSKLAIFPHWWRYHSEGFAIQALEEVMRRYPVDADRVILTGYSMGGYGTWNIGLRFSGRFAAVAPFAGGIARSEMIWPRHEDSRALLSNAHDLPLFFVHGNRDRTVPVRFSRTISEDLERLGVEHVYREVDQGGHILMPFLRGNELTDELTGWLAQQERAAWPKQIERVALDADHGRDRWLQIDALRGKRGRVVAKVEGQTIHLDGEGVDRVSLFLDPQLVDLSQPVRVTWQGAELFAEVVQPSWEALESSFNGDPSTAAAARIQLQLPRIF